MRGPLNPAGEHATRGRCGHFGAARHNRGVTAKLSPEDQERIDARYPKRTLGDLAIGGLAGVALLIAIGLVVAAGIQQANPAAVAMVRSFDVRSPQLTVAEVVVQRKDPAQPAECFVYAQARSFERVAELTIEVPPDTDMLTVMNIEIATIKEATSVSIEDCHIID